MWEFTIYGCYPMAVMFARLLALAGFLLSSAISAAKAGEFWLAAGSGLDSRGLVAWQAVTSAPLASLDSAGPRLRVFLSQSKGDNSAAIEGGWSFGQHQTRGDVLVGLNIRQEPDRKRLSPVVSAGLDRMIGGGGISTLGMLRPAYGEVWAEFRPWLWLDECWKVGVLAASGGVPFAAGFRAGVFTSGYRVVLPGVRELFLGGELGFERDGHGEAFTPYGGVNLGFGF
jgi:hypothetical protein